MAENVMAASFSIVKTTADKSGTFFLTGIVKAAMKKVTYNLKIVVDLDAVEIKG